MDFNPLTPPRESDVLRPLKVLLVDDQPTVRLATHYLLKGLSCNADAAVNGLEALETLDRQDYDVVLMDLSMPVMDGLEATRRLRDDPSRTRQPFVIALTANDSIEERDLCKAVGMDGFIAKPLTVGKLLEALEPFLERVPRLWSPVDPGQRENLMA